MAIWMWGFPLFQLRKAILIWLGQPLLLATGAGLRRASVVGAKMGKVNSSPPGYGEAGGRRMCVESSGALACSTYSTARVSAWRGLTMLNHAISRREWCLQATQVILRCLQAPQVLAQLGAEWWGTLLPAAAAPPRLLAGSYRHPLVAWTPLHRRHTSWPPCRQLPPPLRWLRKLAHHAEECQLAALEWNWQIFLLLLLASLPIVTAIYT